MSKVAKILFPTDFSDTANNALSHALRIADPQGLEIIVQHVVDDYFGPHSHWASLFDVHELQKELDFHIENEVRKAIPSTLSGVKIRPVLSEGKPDQEILKLAEKENPDLIVMGPAKSAVTSRVIGQATQPVLAVPQRSGGAPAVGLGRILVTTDFSHGSKRAVNHAFDLKDRSGCDVYLVHAIETGAAMYFGLRQGTFLEGRQDTVAKMKEWAANQLKNATPQKYVKDAGVHQVVREGAVAGVISDLVKELNPDVVIVGTREHGTAHQYLVGNTADKILRKVDAPILALRLYSSGA